MLLSLAVGVGELVGVLERACELVACGGCFAERVLALVVEAGGEVGERLDAMLELADQRQAGVRELGACERGWLGGEAVEGEVEVLLAGLVAEQFGVDLEAGELRDRSRGPASDGPQLGRERAGGVGAVRVGAVVDGDREQVTAGVAHVRECLVDRGELPFAGAGALLACGDRGAQRVVSALPRAVHAAQPFGFGVDLGLFEDQRVAGRDRFELGEADHVVAEVLDLADVQAAAHHLVDEPGFAFEGLPHVGIERALGNVTVYADLAGSDFPGA